MRARLGRTCCLAGVVFGSGCFFVPDGNPPGASGDTSAGSSGGGAATSIDAPTTGSPTGAEPSTTGSGIETDGMSSGTGQESQSGSDGSTSTSTGEVPGTTGEPVDCGAAVTKEECLALDCMPIEGQAFVFDGAIWCLPDAKTFLGCLQQMGCDEAITTVCKGPNNIYQLPSGCFPNNYATCEPPPDPGMDGYPSC